jgi:hypothetical protein
MTPIAVYPITYTKLLARYQLLHQSNNSGTCSDVVFDATLVDRYQLLPNQIIPLCNFSDVVFGAFSRVVRR